MGVSSDPDPVSPAGVGLLCFHVDQLDLDPSGILTLSVSPGHPQVAAGVWEARPGSPSVTGSLQVHRDRERRRRGELSDRYDITHPSKPL